MMAIRVGQKLEVTVKKIALGGDGIAHKDGFVIFVPYTCAGDFLEVQIIEKRKNFARAHPLRIIEKSPDRMDPPCPYFFNFSRMPHDTSPPLWCGGCNFQQLQYPAQLKQKEQSFAEALRSTGSISSEKILPILSLPEKDTFRFRNKIQLPFARGKNGELHTGFFAPNSHQIIAIDDCLIHPEEMLEIVKFVKRCLENWQLEPYFEKTHQGWLRHLLIRQSHFSRELLVIFVTCNPSFPYRERWIDQFKANFSKVIGLWQNVNPAKTNVILGKSWRRIWGASALMERLPALSLQLKVSASSFFQVNPKMAEKMYGLARDFILENVTHRKVLLDLYCGVGGIGLVCAPFFEKVVGVDENPSSISDAKSNAKLNHCSNCRFICSAVEEFMQTAPQAASQLEISAVVLNPPRKGVPEEVLYKILKLLPEKIVYVSCDPSTLLRDLKIVISKNYRIKKIQPLDFFPQSSHIESITLLERSGQ